MDRRLGAWVNLVVQRSGSVGGSVTSSFSGPVMVRQRGESLRKLRVSLRELSVLFEDCTVGE